MGVVIMEYVNIVVLNAYKIVKVIGSLYKRQGGIAMSEEDIKHIKWERDYYNYGSDWETCNEFTADDLIYTYKRKRWWQFWKKT